MHRGTFSQPTRVLPLPPDECWSLFFESSSGGLLARPLLSLQPAHIRSPLRAYIRLFVGVYVAVSHVCAGSTIARTRDTVTVYFGGFAMSRYLNSGALASSSTRRGRGRGRGIVESDM